MKDVRAKLTKGTKAQDNYRNRRLPQLCEWVSTVKKKSYLFTFDTSQGTSAATQVSFLSKTKK